MMRLRHHLRSSRVILRFGCRPDRDKKNAVDFMANVLTLTFSIVLIEIEVHAIPLCCRSGNLTMRPNTHADQRAFV
jgi:hypothetical protein